MTRAEAGQVVYYLNSAFHREALEPDTVAFWISEIEPLKHFEHALAAAKNIARNSDRFPTLRHFREDYLRRIGREADRLVGIEQVASGPRELPPEALALMAKLGIALKEIPKE